MKKCLFFTISFILILCNKHIYASEILVEPEIPSYSACLINLETNTIVYSKNDTEKVFPASTTKILTAIITLDKFKLEDRITVLKSTIDLLPQYSSHVNLKAGETLTVKDLLYCLMLSSANDAALVLANAICTDINKFPEIMNAKAKEIGCTNTNFSNPHGYHDENHYTTAYDMALIMKEYLKNPQLKAILQTPTYTTDATIINNPRELKNTNKMMQPDNQYYYPYILGGKTGYTLEAEKTLVTYAKKDDCSYILSIFNEPYSANKNLKYDEVKILLEYAFNNFSNKTIIKRNTRFNAILDYSLLEKKYMLLKDDLIMTTPNSYSNSVITDYNIIIENNEIQFKNKISGLSTKLEKNINLEQSLSTRLAPIKENFFYELYKKIKVIFKL